MRTPAYVPAILRLWQSGAIPRGALVQLDVEHDAACSLLASGVCDCAPLVSVPAMSAPSTGASPERPDR